MGTSGLDLRLGLFEARRRFTNWLGLRADAAWARLATGDGDETVDGRRAAVDQQRLGIELSPSTHLGGFAVEPFAEASARRDGGAGQTGSGLEVSGGLRAVGGPVRIDARGRILLLHSARGYEERGLGVTLTIGSLAAEEGFSLSVSPRWGGSSSATFALWNETLPGRARAGTPEREAWSLDAQARYAIRLPEAGFSSGPVRSAAPPAAMPSPSAAACASPSPKPRCQTARRTEMSSSCAPIGRGVPRTHGDACRLGSGKPHQACRPIPPLPRRVGGGRVTPPTRPP